MAKIYDFGGKGKFKVRDDGSVQQYLNGKWATVPGVTVKGNTVYANGKKFGTLSDSSGNVTYTAQGQTASGNVRKEVPPPPVEPGVVRGYNGPYVDVGGVVVPEYTMRFKTPSHVRTMQPTEGLQLLGKQLQFPNGETFNVVQEPGRNYGTVYDANGNQIGQLSVTPVGVLFSDTNGGKHWIGMSQNGPHIRIGGQESTFRVAGKATTPPTTATSPFPAPSEAQGGASTGFTAPTVFDFGDAGVFRIMPDGSVAQWDLNTGQWAGLPGVTVSGNQVLQNGQPLGTLTFGDNGVSFSSGGQTVMGNQIPFDQWSPPQTETVSPGPEIGTGAQFAQPSQTPTAGTGGQTTVPGAIPFPVSFGGLPVPGGVNAPHATVGAAELAAQQGRMIPASFVLGQNSGNPYTGIWGFLTGDAFAVTDNGNVFQWDPNSGLFSLMQGVNVSPSGEVQVPGGAGQINMMPSGEMVYELGGKGNVGYRVG